MIEVCSVEYAVCVYTGRGKSIWKWRGDRRTWGVIIGDLVMKRPPVEFSWDWCEQKKYCGFSSKNWYLLLVSVRAWFSSKISDDYPCTPVTFMWEYSTPPFPGLRINFFAMCCTISFLQKSNARKLLERSAEKNKLVQSVQPSFTTHV